MLIFCKKKAAETNMDQSCIGVVNPGAAKISTSTYALWKELQKTNLDCHVSREGGYQTSDHGGGRKMSHGSVLLMAKASKQRTRIRF